MMALSRRTLLGLGAAFAASAWPAWAQTEPSAAAALVNEQATAAAEGKGVLLQFYASWCGWCQPMDQLLESSVFTRVISPRFRTYRVRAIEMRENMRRQQLAGADDIYRRYAPEHSGLPFLVFIAADGRTLINSVAPATNENIGYPVAREELDWFDTMVRTAAPQATRDERLAILRACVRLAG
ncbi:MAG: thioredoxin family protein [Alphaproteobacteria bacterium]|nr:thioredoxin family protein [Alphaproteobacteria bacterium]